MLGTRVTMPSWHWRLLGYAWRYRIVVTLVAASLASRLPLLSVSIDEVDAANFINALSYGYDISEIRPHSPGYPVYVFVGWIVNLLFDNPLRTLTVLSAVLGSLAVIPFYSLAREFTDEGLAFAGSLIFVVNPLIWSFSETALSDIPSMFLAISLAWLCYRGRHNNVSLMLACIVASLAIGFRLPNLPLMLLLVFPFGYRVMVFGRISWLPLLMGAALFIAASVAWIVPMIWIGADGVGDYFTALNRQWSGAVRPFDFTQVGSPFVPNLILRVIRFFLGYALLYPWTASDAKTVSSLFLVAPWVFGFGLFLMGFSFRNPRHVFVVLWSASIICLILAIHFLPRYALPQVPGFIMASLIGYHFLARKLPSHPRLIHIVVLLALGAVFVLYGIKYQTPVNTFEYAPYGGIEVVPVVFFAVGGLFVLGAMRLYRLHAPAQWPGAGSASHSPTLLRTGLAIMPAIVLIGLLALVVPYSIKGYASASIAHAGPSPNHQVVEFVTSTFEGDRIVSCWDNQTHSFFDALAPGVVSRIEPPESLRRALETGYVVVATDKCNWLEWLQDHVELIWVATFIGDSPLWAKTPSINLYVAETKVRTPYGEPSSRRVAD